MFCGRASSTALPPGARIPSCVPSPCPPFPWRSAGDGGGWGRAPFSSSWGRSLRIGLPLRPARLCRLLQRLSLSSFFAAPTWACGLGLWVRWEARRSLRQCPEPGDVGAAWLPLAWAKRRSLSALRVPAWGRGDRGRELLLLSFQRGFSWFYAHSRCCTLLTESCSSHKIYFPQIPYFCHCLCAGMRAGTSCPAVLPKTLINFSRMHPSETRNGKIETIANLHRK